MIIYLPCKFGEMFTPLKFVGFENGKRKYAADKELVLKGFSAGEYQIRSLSIPIIHTNGRFLSYDPQGEFPQEFIPKYKIEVDVSSQASLEEKEFIGKRTVVLHGISWQEDGLYADMVTKDRYEHLLYPIKDTIVYAPVESEVQKTEIIWDRSRENV